LGFSYRLDARDGADSFGKLMHQLKLRRMLKGDGGKIRAVYFAGLPRACDLVSEEFAGEVAVFYGDENSQEVPARFGVPLELYP